VREETLPVMTSEKNLIWIYSEPVQAVRAGLTVFDTAIFVRVETPGSNKSNMIYKIKVVYSDDAPNGRDKLWINEAVWPRFGKYVDEWEANQGKVATSGTPIEEWPMVNASQAALLKFHGVYTVETLPNLSDAQIANLGMNTRKLVEQAKDWLAQRADGAHAMKLAEEKRALEDRLTAMEAQLKEQAEFMAAFSETMTEEQIDTAQNSVARKRGAARVRKYADTPPP
jgi:hypothetical protein